MNETRMRGGWRLFALLCLIAGSRWIVEGQWPQVASTLRSEAWACGVAALLMFAGALALRRPPPGVMRAVELLAVGGGLLAAPVFGVAFNGTASNSFNRTVALCFVPTIATVLSSIWSDDATSPSLWPGLAGLGGALLIFPLMLPESAFGYVVLLAPVIIVGAACIMCRQVARGVANEWSAVLIFAGGAIGLTVLEAARVARIDVPAEPVAVAAIVVDAVLAGLTVYVVLRMDAIRYTSRYFVVPLLTILQGMIIFRSGITLRLCAGVALLVVAAGALLRTREGVTSGLSLR